MSAAGRGARAGAGSARCSAGLPAKCETSDRRSKEDGSWHHPLRTATTGGGGGGKREGGGGRGFDQRARNGEGEGEMLATGRWDAAAVELGEGASRVVAGEQASWGRAEVTLAPGSAAQTTRWDSRGTDVGRGQLAWPHAEQERARAGDGGDMRLRVDRSGDVDYMRYWCGIGRALVQCTEGQSRGRGQL